MRNGHFSEAPLNTQPKLQIDDYGIFCKKSSESVTEVRGRPKIFVDLRRTDP